jgi:hypothetical protein
LEIIVWECEECGDLIFSRALHDYHYCSCGKLGIDGGISEAGIMEVGKNSDNYVRLITNGSQNPKSKVIEIPQTRKELFDDWNEGEDKYGIIRSKI